MFICDEVKRDQVILESIRTRLLKISVRSRSSKQQVSSPDNQQTYLYLDQSKAGWHNRHGADLDLLTPGKTNRLLESETFPGEELDVILSWLHSDLLKDGEALDLEVWTPFPVSVDRERISPLVEPCTALFCHYAMYKAPKLNSLELCILQHSSGSRRYPNWYRHKISSEQKDIILQDEKSAASAKGQILFSDEMRDIVLCHEKGKKVKTVGCGHSFSDLACTTDFMISMARYNRVLKVSLDSVWEEMVLNFGLLYVILL
ncbi:hypothetical protein RRG08_028638, partial [Elysia crispata]